MGNQQLKGLIIKSTGSWYEVLNEESREVFRGRLRGKFKVKGLKVTNPIAVGDYVLYEQEEVEEETVVIKDILPRENYILRRSTHKKWHGHIIAANVDQAIMVATLGFPRTSLGFIDRFLVSAESFRIPAVILFNKTDLLTEEGIAFQEELMELYESLGYRCLSISALTEENLQAVEQLLDGKKSLIAGHSGVGKSTLINALLPHVEQRTAEVSTYANKGKHTTTFAEMFAVDDHGTFLIDTPGIKELGIMNVEENELGHYFPEIREAMEYCKFHNCTHTHEPNCEVRNRLETEEIAESRYISYLSILEDDDNRR
ncbi:ribosome small subunit-dependent GTPase A [Algivirga pacifica]|uniref:Small ribosomal subunit biogenesis GTPase RsgA n=1 Tax=Algivirga pacifica TaxID=1162670 RepID=A0ABP9D3S3_9BACT